MQSTTRDQLYRDYHTHLQFRFQNVELSHCVSLLIWGAAKGNSLFSYKRLCHFFLAYDVYSLKLPEDNGLFSTFMEVMRKDHFELYNSVLERLSIHPAVNELFKLKKRVSFHPRNTLRVVRCIYMQIKPLGLPFFERISWCAEYALLCNTLLDLDKINFSGVRKYLCMCSVIGLENLLTQYLRNKGVVTFSLQDGIYYLFKKNFVIGSISYEHFAADHLLCWGQYTKDEYVSYGISPERIDVAGYPKGSVQRFFKGSNNYYKGLVLLAGTSYGDVNNDLLIILDSLKGSIEFVLKPHPANYSIIESYANSKNIEIIPRSMTLNQCFESGLYDFCIAVNTTAYYESWMSGIPCLRYYDDRFDNFFGFDDLFSTREELDLLLNKYRTTPKSENEVREMLEYAIGFGIDNYDRIVNG